MDFTVVEDNFFYYLYWMKERMDIFWRKLEDSPVSIQKDLIAETKIWTNDAILVKHKFTNVYRCLDRVSQYLIKEIIYNGKAYTQKDMIFRIILFKHFNKIETWELLLKEFGDITCQVSFTAISDFIDTLPSDIVIYSNAFMLTASFMRSENLIKKMGINRSDPKHREYTKIFDYYLNKEGYYEKILSAVSLKHLTGILSDICAVGPFLSMQYAIDLNYSELFDFDENEFVIAGVGALRFLDQAFTFKKSKGIYEELVYWISQNIEDLRKEYSQKRSIDLTFRPLPGRNPTLIDLQNCCCESFKYLKGIKDMSQFGGGKRIKQVYSENKQKITYVFPNKWGKVL